MSQLGRGLSSAAAVTIFWRSIRWKITLIFSEALEKIHFWQRQKLRRPQSLLKTLNRRSASLDPILYRKLEKKSYFYGNFDFKENMNVHTSAWNPEGHPVLLCWSQLWFGHCIIMGCSHQSDQALNEHNGRPDQPHWQVSNVCSINQGEILHPDIYMDQVSVSHSSHTSHRQTAFSCGGGGGGSFPPATRTPQCEGFNNKPAVLSSTSGSERPITVSVFLL